MENEQYNNIKRVKCGELLLAVSGNKFIIKDIKERKHITIMITKDYIDIHETEEGRVKKYKPIIRIKIDDLKEIFEKIIEYLKEEFSRFNRFKIDIDDPKFAKYIVLIPKDKNTLINRLFTKKGRTLELPKDMIEDPRLISEIYILVLLSKVKEYNFRWAVVFNPEENQRLVLLKVDDNYFLFNDEDLITRLNRFLPFEI